MGQPDVDDMELDNPIVLPRALGFLTYNRFGMEIRGLEEFPPEDRPDNIALHYYAYHVMVGLGTIFILILAAAAWRLWRGHLFESRGVLWVLMLSLPFPFIANTAGWMTAELGRQPWTIYGLMRTADSHSTVVSAGNVMFTLLGFAGMYALLTVLYLLLMVREVHHRPPGTDAAPAGGDGDEVAS